MKNIRTFESFVNESNSYMEVEYDNSPGTIVLVHDNGKIEIELDSANNLGDLIKALDKAQKELEKLNPTVKITAEDDEGDSDRGIGMEWTFPNGKTIYGPDFGVTDNVKKAVESLKKFFTEYKKISISKEEKDEPVYLNFD
jgi:hypothetical protein